MTFIGATHLGDHCTDSHLMAFYCWEEDRLQLPHNYYREEGLRESSKDK